MSSILDRAAELEKEWEEQYRQLKFKSRTPEEEEQYYKLGVRLGWITPKRNADIECIGCGS